MEGMPKQVEKALAATPGSRTSLRLADFSLSEDVASERTNVASLEADLPFRFREDRPPRMAFVVCEEFTTDGTGDNQEEFTLTDEIVDAPATQALVLFEGTSVVQPDSIDYDGGTFKYTDDGTENRLHAFYTVRAQNQIVIEVTAPDAGGQTSKVVFDGVGTLIHEQDQNQEPLSFDFDLPVDAFVPKKWTVDVYVDGATAYSWDDSDEANSAGVSAPNALLSLPITQAAEDVPGLDRAVRRSISNPGR